MSGCLRTELMDGFIIEPTSDVILLQTLQYNYSVLSSCVFYFQWGPSNVPPSLPSSLSFSFSLSLSISPPSLPLSLSSLSPTLVFPSYLQS